MSADNVVLDTMDEQGLPGSIPTSGRKIKSNQIAPEPAQAVSNSLAQQQELQASVILTAQPGKPQEGNASLAAKKKRSTIAHIEDFGKHALESLKVKTVRPYTSFELLEMRAKTGKACNVIGYVSCCGCCKWNIWHPHSKGRLLWDISTMFLLIYLFIGIPIRVCFPRAEVHPFNSFWGIVNLLVDIFFSADVFVQFKTGYYYKEPDTHQERLVVDAVQIAKKYLRTWFLLDVITSIPIEHVVYLSTGEQSNTDMALVTFPKILRFVKYARVMRLFRVQKLFQIARRWDDNSIMLATFFRWCKFFAIVFITVHIVSCVWMLVATWHMDAQGHFEADSWPGSWSYEMDPDTVHFAKLYLVSTYWAVVTLTTVGFGDITPRNEDELVVAMFVTLLGTGAFAYIVGTVQLAITRTNHFEAAFTARMEALSGYVKYRKLPGNLDHRIRRHFAYQWEKANPCYSEREYLEAMPSALRNDVIEFLFRDAVEKVPLLKNLSSRGLRVLANSFEPQLVSPGEVVYDIAEPAEYMYIVLKGACEEFDKEGQLISRYVEGEYFGYGKILSGANHETKVMVHEKAQKAELLKLPGPALKKLIDNEHERFREHFAVNNKTWMTKANAVSEVAAVESKSVLFGSGSSDIKQQQLGETATMNDLVAVIRRLEQSNARLERTIAQLTNNNNNNNNKSTVEEF